jgi:hypothetical protein
MENHPSQNRKQNSFTFVETFPKEAKTIYTLGHGQKLTGQNLGRVLNFKCGGVYLYLAITFLAKTA